jgi:hypothetical protein
VVPETWLAADAKVEVATADTLSTLDKVAAETPSGLDSDAVTDTRLNGELLPE